MLDTAAFFTPTGVATAKIGVFRVSEEGLAEPIQWLDTGGYNTRDCELSADESMLFAVDVVASKFLAYRTDPLTGMLTLLGSASVPNPTMIEQYKHPTMTTCAVHHAARFRDHLGHHAAIVAKASAGNPLATVAICVALAMVAVACCCAPANLRKTCANVLPDHWSGKSATTGRRVGSLMIPEQVGNPLL